MPCMPTWESCEPLIATIRQSLEKIWVNKFMPISDTAGAPRPGPWPRAVVPQATGAEAIP